MSSSERPSGSTSHHILPHIPLLTRRIRTGYREFAQSTILTIAHRLRTVIDYDRVRFPAPVLSVRKLSC